MDQVSRDTGFLCPPPPRIEYLLAYRFWPVCFWPKTLTLVTIIFYIIRVKAFIINMCISGGKNFPLASIKIFSLVTFTPTFHLLLEH